MEQLENSSVFAHWLSDDCVFCLSACGVDILSKEDTNKVQSKPGVFYISVLYEKEKRKKQICTTATMFQQLNPAVVFVCFSSL